MNSANETAMPLNRYHRQSVAAIYRGLFPPVSRVHLEWELNPKCGYQLRHIRIRIRWIDHDSYDAYCPAFMKLVKHAYEIPLGLTVSRPKDETHRETRFGCRM
jgi:hypothetical protein